MSKSTFRNSSKNYFFNACFDKNQLKNLISWFIKQSGEKITVDFLEALKQVGFHQATKAGVSLGLDDLQIPLQKSFFISQANADISLFEQQARCGNLTSVEKSQRMISTWNQTSEILRKTAVQNFKNTNQVNPVYMMAFSGARGNISQVRQLVAMRGLMADPQGTIVEFPIQSNFREGLTLTEYLISCFGARKGLVDTALRTATSGYLTRRLVDAAQHVIVSLKDCGTTEGFRIRNKDLEHHLIGRVLSKDVVVNSSFQLKRNQLLSPSLAKLVSKKSQEVFVRSPLTCQAENSLCQLCYGWNLAHGKVVSLGDAVGVIAAQSIGEPGTQLTMRTFHTGGVGVFSDQAMKYFLAPYDGIIEYSEGLPGHFVRTPHGKIVYMLKNVNTVVPNATHLEPKTSENILLTLKSKSKKQKCFFIKKQDLPAGSILLVRQGEWVKTGQVLAQASQFKKSKQKMPESTHPVFSPLSGEIHLESLILLKQKEFPANLKKISKNPKKLTEKQKKEKERGPDIRTLKGLGSFWIFSSQNQQEFQVTKTILRAGDLMSSKTPFFQYDFYVPTQSIFESIRKKSCLGINTVSFSLEKINFHKRTYSLIVKNSSGFFQHKNSFAPKQNQRNKQEVFFFNKKRHQNFLIWFPSGSVIPSSGYLFNFLLYSALKTQTSVNSSFSFRKIQLNDPSKTKKNLQSLCFTGSFFYTKTKIQKLTIDSPVVSKTKKLNYLLNLNSHTTLKQNHFLQYSPTFQNVSSVKILETQNTFFPKSKSLWNATEKNIKIKTKNFSWKQKNYLLDSNLTKPSDFVQSALTKMTSSLTSKFYKSSLLIQQKKGWIYVPITNKIMNKSKRFVISEQGKGVDIFFFFTSKISRDSISLNNITLLKSLKTKNAGSVSTKKWYSKKDFLTQESFLFTEKKQDGRGNFFSEKNDSTVSTCFLTANKNFLKNYFHCCIYYGTKKQSFNFKTSIHPLYITRPVEVKIKQTKNDKTSCFIFVCKLNEFSLPKKRDLIKQWFSIKRLESASSTNSPLFTKQQRTFFTKEQKMRRKYQILLSKLKGSFSEKNIFQVLLNLNSPFLFKKIKQSSLVKKSLNSHKIPILGLQIFHYNVLSLPEKVSFTFEIFENQWVTPHYKLTNGFIRIKQSGEFRRLKSQDNQQIACILTKKDLVTLDLSKFCDSTSTQKNLTKNKQIRIGGTFRPGTEILSKVSSSFAGLILTKTCTHLTLRLGIPFLASARGVFHIFQDDLVQKNDLLVTLKSRRLQTEDIVQGIPKIEQLFEARETQAGILIRNSAHTRLKKYFLSSLKSEKVGLGRLDRNLAHAVNRSYTKIQFFLVQSILQAYSSQGVKISQKHIEIIVRQMTSRVRILAGGDTGLLPGEIVQFTRIQKVNEQLYLVRKRPALYEPLILGITKSVLQSESFLLSASFQEVSRVLVRSALAQKTDFLRGLHENVILGQLVPTGTGLISNTLQPLEKK